MQVISDCYFKTAYDDPVRLISGLPLPDPSKGPYRFIDCDFHPAVDNELKKNYQTSEFIDCYGSDYAEKLSERSRLREE